MSPSPSLEGRVCILYMIGDENGYDDDDDGDDVMIISPSPSLEGRVRMMYIYNDYFAESLTRKAGHLIC